MGFGVWGLGFGVCSLRFRVWNTEFRARFWVRVKGEGVRGLGFRV